MKDVMIDLETLGVKPGAIILSIGAAKFDLKTGLIDADNTFYENIQISDSVEKGFSITGETIEWWFKQSDDARLSLFEDPAPTKIKFALEEFARWLPSNARIWGNGVGFDNMILRKAYDMLDLEVPWHFRADRDVRTLVALGRSLDIELTPADRQGTHHHALDDALYQIRYCVEIFKRIKQ